MTATSTRPQERSAFLVLVLPLHDEDVLVKGEMYYYKSRAHWASLANIALETASIVFLSLLVISRVDPGQSDLVFASAVIVSAMIVYRMIRRRDWGIQDTILALLLGLWFIAAGLSLEAVAFLVAFCAIVRFTLALVRWQFYEVRYITNRRLIEVSGLLGRRISSMPIRQVTDITLDRSVAGEWFDYATLRVESAGQDQALGTVPYLEQPDYFHEAVIHLSTVEVT